jgi:ligand-binding sensor domain-containing protein
MKNSITILFCLLCLSFSSIAQISWNPTNGPYGGSITKLVNNGTEIFAGSTDGIYVSDDNASSWSKNNMINMNVIDMERTDDGKIYAACMGAMYYSDDDGSSWTTINGNVGSANFKACRLNSQGDIFSIVHFSHQWNKLHYSTNNGSYWRMINTPIQLIQVINVNTANDHLYIGTFQDGIYRSTDNGETIEKVGLDTLSLRCISFDDNNYVYAGTNGQGVYRSTDNGNSWSYFGMDGYNIYSFYKDSNGDFYAGTYFYGVFRSTDGGASWNEFNNGLKYETITGFMEKGPDLYLSCNGGGAFRLNQNNITWENCSKGIKNVDISIIRYSQDGTLYVGSNGSGFFYSTNSGLSWVNSGRIGINDISNMIVTSSGAVLVGTWGHGIYKTTDKGATWTNSFQLETYARIGAFSMDEDGTVYTSASNYGVIRSTDEGESWENIGLSDIASINAVCAAYEGTIFAATYSNGLYRSINGGIEWEEMSTAAATGLELLYLGGENVLSGGYGGIVEKTTNNGESWIQIINTIFDVTDMMKDDNNNIYMTTRGRGVYTSANGGTDWNMINTGLNDMNVYSITSNETGALFVGTNDGVYSTDIIDPSLIGIPELISPTNNSIAISKDTVLYWGITQGALYYDLEVATDECFNNVILRENSISGTSFFISKLDHNKDHYWHVRARNDDFVGEWSDTWSFRTALQKPMLIYPMNQSSGIPDETALEWEADDEIILSYLQISTDNTFDPDKLLFDGITEEINKHNISLFYNTKYYWRVKVKSDDNESGWSDKWCFTIALEQPLLISPTNKSNENKNELSFKWEVVDEANHYTIQVLLDSLGNNVFTEVNTNNNSKDLILEYDAKYYWRVKALNSYNSSGWSEIWSFMTLPAELEKPVLKSPDNKSENVETSINLTWYNYPNPQKDSVRIQISKTNDLDNALFDETVGYRSSYEISNLENNQEYIWRIKVIVGERESPWSDTWSFNTEKKALTAPILILPENDTELEQLVLHFEWSKVEETYTYHIQVSEDPAFSEIFKDNDNVGNNLMIYEGFEQGKTYYWRVKATNQDSEGPWSETWKFSIQEASSGIIDMFGKSNEIRVFPNPFDDKIFIELLSYDVIDLQTCSVELFDLSSRLLLSTEIKLNQGKALLDINKLNLSTGIFILKVQTVNKLYICKIIKK